jgi:hypothetical protein
LREGGSAKVRHRRAWRNLACRRGCIRQAPHRTERQRVWLPDATNRVYRGLDPSLFPQDRVEVVQFPNPGTYLVVCGVLPHFIDKMWGWVKVNP